MRIVAASLVLVLTIGACSSDGGQQTVDRTDDSSPFAPPSSDEIADAAAAFQPNADSEHANRSAVAALTEERRTALGENERALAGLLPSPDGFGAFRLASLQLDDPNGDARFGDYWYPPRILRQDCSAKIDAAPGPYAVANYLPGTGELDDEDPMLATNLFAADLVVGIQVQLFDDAAQRDAYLETTVEFYRDPTFTCGGKEMSIQTYRETALDTSHGTATVFEPEPQILGSGVRAYMPVGERVLLVASVGNAGVDAPWEENDLDRWVTPVLDVAAARLDAAELP